MTKQLAFVVCIFLTFSSRVNAQVTIGEIDQPNPSAVLDLRSNGKLGMLLPRVVLTDTLLVNPLDDKVKGMLVYNTTASPDGKMKEGIYYNDGSRWWHLPTLDPKGTDVWYTTGNAETNPERNFIGTADKQSLELKVSNVHSGFISNTPLDGTDTTNYSLNNSFGYSSLGANGEYNNAFGHYALQANTGDKNSAFGNGALQKNTTGIGNTSVGYAALPANTTGSYNTAIGSNAGAGIITGSYNLAIGSNAGFTTDGSNRMNIGNALFGVDMPAAIDEPAGTIGIGTNTPNISAVLDLENKHKGFLLPRVNLTSSTDASTIAHPATGLMAFNVKDTITPIPTTLEDNSFYYNAGTAAAPSWTMLQPFTPSAGLSVKNMSYTATTAIQDSVCTVGRFKFRFTNNSGTVPQICLVANPGATISVYYHYGEYWPTETDFWGNIVGGRSYTSATKSFTSANYATYQNLGNVTMSNSERNVMWVTYPGDSSMYHIEFVVIGSNPSTFSIIVSQY